MGTSTAVTPASLLPQVQKAKRGFSPAGTINGSKPPPHEESRAACYPLTSQQEREVEGKDAVWLQSFETHAKKKATISSKLCICWSCRAALLKLLLDPYVAPCSSSQTHAVGAPGPQQDKARSPRGSQAARAGLQPPSSPKSSSRVPPISRVSILDGNQQRSRALPPLNSLGKLTERLVGSVER